jgi:hypothetical protein
MIALTTLTYLATQKARDANVLLQYERYNGAVYLMGYALELSLKRKLSHTLGFMAGFPESNAELRHYYHTQLASLNAINTGITLHQINQIRHHKLSELLKFTGAEARIIAAHFHHWHIVCQWDPGKRYVRQNWTRDSASNFVHAAYIILKQIK